MNAWKSPIYSADTRKNPNSPVAHQPNVSYDHRLPPSPYSQAAYQGYHSHRSPQQQYQYHPYIPPQSYASTAWKPPSSTIDSNLRNGMSPYTHLPQHNTPLPSYPFSQGLQGLPPSAYPHSSGQKRSASSPGPKGHAPSQPVTQAGPHGRSSMSVLMSNPSGTPNPPNLDGGAISQEWTSKQPPTPNTADSKPAPPHEAPTSAHRGYCPHHDSHPSPQSSDLSVPRPSAQFQSPDAFQREMARSNQPAEAPKWEQMLKQLATSTGSGPTGMAAVHAATTMPEASAAQARYASSGPQSGLTYESPKSRVLQPSERDESANKDKIDVDTQALTKMQSPSRDDDKGGGGGSSSGDGGATVSAINAEASTSDLAPVQQQQQSVEQVYGAETWRYSQISSESAS